MVFNHGYGEDMNALEFWRDTVVDFDGGDFVGKQALEGIRDSGGPRRKMMGLLAGPDARIEQGAWELPVLDGESVVGTTRRSTFSRALERTIAIGLMQLDSVEVGMTVEVEHPGGRAPVEVKHLPFIEPRANLPGV